MALTATAVRESKPAKKTRRLYDERGLYLEISPKGGKWWRLKYRFAGKEKRVSLGVYPDVSLKKAREKRHEARAQLADGIDPSQAKRAEKAAQAERAGNSFQALTLEWYEVRHKAKVGASYAERNLSRLKRYLFPLLGSRPIADIQPREILEALRRIETKGHGETAHRVKGLAGQVFRYAVSTGRADRDVTADLRDALTPTKVQHHPAVVDHKEIGPLLRAIDAYSGQPATCAALRLAPLVFLRPGELRKAQWEDIDLNNARWEVTTKGGTPLVVPLSEQAVEILREMVPLTGRREYVFPSNRGRGQPMSNNTLNAALKRLDYGGEMTGHGFRAMARTVLVEQLGFPVEIVEMQLGHRVRDVHGRAYNRTQWLDQRREMMQAWADYLDGLKGGAKVVPITVNQ